MNDRTIGIILGILVLSALGFVYFVNTSEVFDYLGDQLAGEGMGELCSSRENCQKFCQTSMGRCRVYCQQNPTNSLCRTLIK